jgi:hypothetical protein
MVTADMERERERRNWEEEATEQLEQDWQHEERRRQHKEVGGGRKSVAAQRNTGRALQLLRAAAECKNVAQGALAEYRKTTNS